MPKIQLATGRFLGAIALLSVTLSACNQNEPQASEAPPPIPVEIQNLDAQKVTETSQFIGRLEATERVILAPRVDGLILDILVEEGESVTAGQRIAELQLTREQEEVNAAISNVNAQKANLNNAKAAVKTAEAEEARVAAEVGQREADLREQKAELELARANLKRAEFLVSEGVQSQQLLDERTRDLNMAIASQESLEASLNASKKALAAAREEVGAALAAVDGAKANLEQAEAQVGVANQELDYNRLVSPISGVVGDIVPKIGDYVEVGEEITTITQNDALSLNLSIPIQRSSQLELGLPVEIINESGEPSVEGQIGFIAPRVNSSQQTILAKAIFPNNGSLRDDQRVNAKVIWSEEPGVLVPTESVSRIGGQSFVFVAEEQQGENGQTMLVAKQKPVELNPIPQGQAYPVISGVEPGERLIVSGILNLSDGAPISSESMTSDRTEPKSKENL